MRNRLDFRCGKAHTLWLTAALSVIMSAPTLPFQPALAANAESAKADSSATPTAEVYKQVEELVHEYYPKAKVTVTGTTMHFELKVRPHIGSYSNKSELSPDLGGILGDLQLKSGAYGGREKLPTELNEYVHVVLLMAPYSKPQNSHLLSKVAYPPDTSVDFLDRMKTIVGTFAQGGEEIAAAPTTMAAAATTAVASTPAPASPATTATTSVATAAATAQPATTTTTTTSTTSTTSTATTTTAVPATPPAAKEAPSDFGGSKMSKYSYPEGRFRVLLPGTPQTKYQNQMNMRMVDYVYPEAQGSYNISYVILPGVPANQAGINLFFDKLTASLIGDIKGDQPKQFAINLQGYPGRQIDVPIIKDKAGQIARFRIYIVRRFVYVVAAAGKKAWVDSPIVNQFMDSFEVSPELTTAEQIQQRSKDMQREAQYRKEQFDKEWAASKQRFSEAESRNRKESEHFRAQWDNNRYRHP